MREAARYAPAAEGRLLDWLTRLRQRETAIRLRIDTGGASSLPKKYRRAFTESLAGVVLAEMADAIVDQTGRDWRPDVIGALDATLAEQNGFLWKGNQRIAPVFFRPRLDTAELIRAEGPKPVRQALLDLLRNMGHHLQGDSDELMSLGDLIYEGVDNVRRHAATMLPRTQDRWFAYVSIRRVDAQELTLLSAEPGSSLDRYRHRHAATERRHFEIVIADNGGGIAATMFGSRRIYQRGVDVNVERERLVAALGLESSITSSKVGRGLGFPHIRDAVAALGGVLSIRSGRIEAHVGGSADQPDLDDVRTLPYPVGTTIAALFPQRSARSSS